MRGTRYFPIRALSILLFVLSLIFLFYLQKSISHIYDSKTSDTDLLARIKAKAQPISLSSPERRTFVIMTTGTYSYRDYLTNLACSFLVSSKNGSYPFQILLLSLDSRLHNIPMPPNVHSVYFNVKTKEFSGNEPAAHFGQRGFDTVTRRKFAAIHAVLSAGFDVLYTDGDIVWCDPSRAVMEIASQADPLEAPIVTQYAHNSGQMMNTGLFYAVSSRDTRNFAYSVETFRAKLTNDQGSANNLACRTAFGGARLTSDHCRWKTTNIRTLEPKKRYILGASKIDGTSMNRMDPKKINQLCNSKEIALMHYSYFGYSAKRTSMASAGFWFYNKERPGKCATL